MKPWIKIHKNDNVLVALTRLEEGSWLVVDGQNRQVTQTIENGHKMALADIPAGENVIKYGSPIGYAREAICAGQWIHSHNLKTNLNDKLEYQFNQKRVSIAKTTEKIPVQLYRRENGEVGIRNELWIIPTVGCVNGIARQLADIYEKENDGCGIDGIFHFPHQFGCSQLGEDHHQTQRLLQNMALHPNAGGVLIVGLGCENNQVEAFRQTLGEYDNSRIRFMVCQEVEDEIDKGLNLLRELHSEMRNDQREPGYLSEVRFGLECGGSDGFSGITANPLLGLFSDRMIAQGGTIVLTEVPEMFGAETLLMERAEGRKVFDDIVGMVNSFKEYYTKHEQPVYENPSPGNKEGGITTLEEKSLGCVQKAGQGSVNTVLDYCERISCDGLTLLNAPGNDAIATSALAAAGCHIVLFTTGRGTPYGGFVPTFKLATNSQLAKKKSRWIDFDGGAVVSSEVSMDELCSQLTDQLVDVVNGQQTCNERNNIRELAVWKNGVTL